MERRGSHGRVPSPRPARGVGAAALAVAVLWASGAAAPCEPASAAEGPADDPAGEALRAEVERLRGEMERAYRAVERDHALVRAEPFASAPLPAAFEAVLGKLVGDARADPAKEAATLAGAALERLREEGVEAPLSIETLGVVLPRIAAAARGSQDAARDLLVVAAREVFAAERAEDSWDVFFQSLPVVVAWRDAHRRMEAARAAPAPPPPPMPGTEAAPPADDMVLFERGPAWVGPWTGWTTDLAEKENRRRTRHLKAFWIDRHEVTCEAYLAFLKGVPVPERKALLPLGWSLADDFTPRAPEGRERHPVTGVTYRQAVAFAESRGGRLPTADEWHRVAAGGGKEARVYPWGDSDEGKRWCRLGCEPRGTAPVDACPDDVTPDGVAGLAGNAAELVATLPDGSDVPRTGPPKGSQLVVCGGSFASRSAECVTSWRWVLDADAAAPTVGFRCVLDDAEYRKRHPR